MTINYEKKAIEAVNKWKNREPIRWVDFERFMGLRRPTEGTIEWKGFVQLRNEVRIALNGMAMEVLNKDDSFQVRPLRKDDVVAEVWEDPDCRLMFLRGNALFDSWLRQQKVRMLNVPVNFVSVMENMVTNFKLPQATRNKAVNYATVGNMLSGVTKKMIEDVLDDPEMKLPDYSREELLRLTIQSADKALSDDKEAG